MSTLFEKATSDKFGDFSDCRGRRREMEKPPGDKDCSVVVLVENNP